jgi:hypothetical protein
VNRQSEGVHVGGGVTTCWLDPRLLLRLYNIFRFVDNFVRHVLAATTDPGAHMLAAAASRLALGNNVFADVFALLGDSFALVDDLVGSVNDGVPGSTAAAMAPASMRYPGLRVGLNVLIGLLDCACRQRADKTNRQTDCKEQSAEHKNFLHVFPSIH